MKEKEKIVKHVHFSCVTGDIGGSFIVDTLTRQVWERWDISIEMCNSSTTDDRLFFLFFIEPMKIVYILLYWLNDFYFIDKL